MPAVTHREHRAPRTPCGTAWPSARAASGRCESDTFDSPAVRKRLAAPPPSPVRLHPNLSDLYRAKVSDLANALTDPEIRTPALEIIRSLIDRVTVRVSEDYQVCLELDGAVCAMIEAAQPRGLDGIDSSSVKVVAGARNTRFLRLVEIKFSELAA